MGFYDDHVLPRIIDVALGRHVDDLRRRVCDGLYGDVLEVGFGTGPNVPFYPSTVTRALAVEPSPGARRLAAPAIASSAAPVEFVGLDGARIDLPGASVDCVLSTWTLCTIPDVDAAVAEMFRLLRPGGQVHFVEHGISPSPSIARWQERIEPAWGAVAGGCRLTRSAPDLLRAHGFAAPEVDVVRKGPELVARMSIGTARR
ncbi:class I SAM-dependent methyltransferase [Williamsia deligens]|uniref:Class I SAM-dependent methyltransferase n=1 Tax=Williamsia deligens TaxID=321325 RepID=A0ABW3GAC5_9NOCA|nr:class I SAM-dependent methyltransferase [Williamsia deligens]